MAKMRKFFMAKKAKIFYGKKRKELKLDVAKSIDPDEVAHGEPPHLGLHYLLSYISIFQCDIA